MSVQKRKEAELEDDSQPSKKNKITSKEEKNVDALNTTKEYPCTWEGCTNVSSSESRYHRHRMIHTIENTPRCDWKGCVFQTTHTNLMAFHTRVHTLLTSYNFNSNDLTTEMIRLQNTMARQTKDRLQKSHKGNDDKSDQKNEPKPHTEKKIHRCKYDGCNYSTKHSGHMKDHTRTHTGEKPFRCAWEGCDYASTQSSNLKAHMAFHTEENPYKCDGEGCEYSTMNHHRMTHTKEKPHECDWERCEYRSTKWNTMKNYKQVHIKRATNPKGLEQIYYLNRTWFGETNNSLTLWQFQKTFEDCKNPKTGFLLQYDFGVRCETYGWVLVELDVAWNNTLYNPKRREEEYKCKKEYAESHGYPLLRIETTTGLKNTLKTFYEENGIIVG